MPVQSGLRTSWVIIALPLLVACRSSGTANQPTTAAPRGVLELRVLAAKSDDEAEKFDGYRAVLARDGPVQLGAEELYGWFPIKYPAEFFKTKDLKRDFGAIQQGSPMVVAQRGDEFFALARTGADCGLTHAKGAPAWCIQTARVNRSTHGYVGVEVELDARAVAQLGKLMEVHAGKEACVFLDGRAVMHTMLKPGVPLSIRLTGPFSLSDAENMAKLLMETKGAPAS